MEFKRSRQVFLKFDESELFPNKKQAVEKAPITNPVSKMNFSDELPCENSTGFERVAFQSNQFVDPRFPVADGSNAMEKVTSEQFEIDYSVDLSISLDMDDEEPGVSYGGNENFLVNPVKEYLNRLHTSVDQSYPMESENPCGEKGGNVALDHSTDVRDTNLTKSTDLPFEEDYQSIYSRKRSNTKSLAHYQKSIIALLESPVSSYSLIYEQSSVLNSKNPTKGVKKSRAPKFKIDSLSRNKPETNSAKKEVPNGNVTNVRSLMVTGMLDGVAVRYISSSQQELLRGIIKGSGYLCGCESCNYSKVINAYEFERHAGCKTNHANNHIYLENGKAMHQIVQEWKNTPLSMLSRIDLPKANSTVFMSQEENTSFKIDSTSKCDFAMDLPKSNSNVFISQEEKTSFKSDSISKCNSAMDLPKKNSTVHISQVENPSFKLVSASKCDSAIDLTNGKSIVFKSQEENTPLKPDSASKCDSAMDLPKRNSNVFISQEENPPFKLGSKSKCDSTMDFSKSDCMMLMSPEETTPFKPDSTSQYDSAMDLPKSNSNVFISQEEKTSFKSDSTSKCNSAMDLPQINSILHISQEENPSIKLDSATEFETAVDLMNGNSIVYMSQEENIPRKSDSAYKCDSAIDLPKSNSNVLISQEENPPFKLDFTSKCDSTMDPPKSNCTMLMSQEETSPFLPDSTSKCDSAMDLPKGNNIVSMSQDENTPFKLGTAPKRESETKSGSKVETQVAKRKGESSFPSNVKSLLMTGMFDGAPVQYIYSSREGALSGLIKGSGYLCGCQSCKLNKLVNAHEFQRHAGCNTHHPNNHIYFVNMKSIAQVVQELKSTPSNMLFDVIQTVTGFPINQKAFDAWKESFLSANRQLQRVYENEKPNMLRPAFRMRVD